MTLDELRALLEVIEAGSINRAAAQLGVPRTTLNRRLDALETRFGTPMLKVSRDGALPTEAGARLARGAKTLLRQAAQLDTAVRLELQHPTRPVQLVLHPGLAPTQIAIGLAQWRREFPDIRMQVQTRADPFAHGLDEQPDFIFSFGRPKQGDYRVFQLLRMRFEFRASSDYLARHGTPSSLDELDDHALWVWEGALMPSGEGPCVLLRDGSQLPIAPQMVLDDSHLLHLIAQRSIGLVLVPSLPFVLTLTELETDEVEVLEGSLGGDIGLWAAVPERNVDLVWTRKLIAGLRALFSRFAATGEFGEAG